MFLQGPTKVKQTFIFQLLYLFLLGTASSLNCVNNERTLLWFFVTNRVQIQCVRAWFTTDKSAYTWKSWKPISKEQKSPLGRSVGRTARTTRESQFASSLHCCYSAVLKFQFENGTGINFELVLGAVALWAQFHQPYWDLILFAGARAPEIN